MKFIKNLLVFLFLVGNMAAFSQTQLWKSSEENRIPNVSKMERQIIPQHYALLQLDFSALKNILSEAPMRFSDAAQSKNVIVEIPQPDGSLQHFRIEETPTMHADLQAKYPNIRSFVGFGIENRIATMRCEYSQNGFSAMILAEGKTLFVDPFAKGNTEYYIAYDKRDFFSDKKMNCEVTDHADYPDLEKGFNQDSERTGDGKLRTYRLALACTGEYAAFHGGTVAGVMAAMNKSVTRVNGIYEKEFSITMTMIANNDVLIYLNANTDPYTNSDGKKMLGENQVTVDNKIGNANYDIGHVFSTGGGGVAQLQSPCKTGSKASGVTGLDTPVNDAFDIDFVAHEMGHQYGGNHTFNNNCSKNINTGTAYETGSGSTIMAYAGVCSPNVQNNSDAYFHLASLLEINTYTVTGTGNTCPQKTNSKNDAQPSVSAGLDYIIPKSTPFELLGAATDADNDPIMYCWEQYDKEIATQAPKATSTTGPAYRSYFPKSSPVRVFPNLDNLTKNTNNIWEVLASVARTYNFRCTARDLHNGFGRANTDAMFVTVNAGAGPFLVTVPNTAVNWEVLNKKTVTWNIANTDLAPINCDKVDILFSTDGGYTFPDTLAKSVANNGSFEITVPNKPTTKARIKVKGANNIFFDMSNLNFTVSLPPVPLFVISTPTPTANVCKEKSDTAIFNLNFASVAGYKENIQLSTVGLPTNAKVAFSQDTITPSGDVKVTFYNLKKISNGVFSIYVKGVGATKKDSIALIVSAFAGIPTISNGVAPKDYKGVKIKGENLVWKRAVNTSSYVVEISKDYLFTTINETATVSDTFFAPTKLQIATVYFWRIKAINHCVDGSYSATYAFQTIDRTCGNFDGTSLPLAIPANAIFDQKIDAVALGSSIVNDLEVKVNISHTFVSDLVLSLESPAGKKVELLTGQCTSNDNVDATFSDAGVALICANLPAVKGIVKPTSPLSTYQGMASNGVWKLRVQDTDDTGAGGTVNAWSIKICSEQPVAVVIDLIKNKFQLAEGTSKAVSSQFLNASSANVQPQDITYLITKLPIQGTLKRGSTPLLLGSKITQQEINTGALLYFNNTVSSALDSFQFLLSTVNNGWLPTQTFYIDVLKGNLLNVTATQTKSILCNNEKNAEIGIDITGGQKPYKYSIDAGKTFQDTSYFSNLASGKYFPTVKDAQGLVKKADSILIKNPDILKITSIKDSNNIFLKIAGGTKPYSISFNNKAFAKIDSFFQLPNGKYPILVKDANNCTTKDTVFISINSLSISALLNKKVLCVDGKTGEIIVNMKGGKTPYQYQLNGGTFQSSNTFSNLVAGDYTVVVKDAEDFTRVSNKVTLDNPTKITATINVVQDSVFAAGVGGTGFLIYSFAGNAYNSKNTFAGLDNGKYKLLLKDENGCTASYDFVINALKLLIADFKAITCTDEKNGELTLAGDGGIKPYSYSIDNGATYQTTGIFKNLSANTYTLTIKDSADFVKTTKYKVTNPTPLSVNTVANGNTITVNVTGGNAPFSYLADGGKDQTSNVFDNLAAGNHSFVVTDANGCKASVFVTGVATFDLEQILGISIAPNPTSDFVLLRFAKPLENIVQMELSDAQGRILVKQNLNATATNIRLEMANYTNGMYQLMLRSGTQFFVTKIVVLK